MPIEILGETMYDIREVAQLLGVTTRTIQTYLAKERLQAQKIGRKWYFNEDNLRAFLREGEPVATRTAEKP